MPIYEYECDSCQMREEIIQKLGEHAPAKCPKCNAKGTLKKVVTSSAFHLKGGGWYKDLYASKKPADSPAKTDTTAPDAKKENKIEKPAKKEKD